MTGCMIAERLHCIAEEGCALLMTPADDFFWTLEQAVPMPSFHTHTGLRRLKSAEALQRHFDTVFKATTP